MRENKCLFIDDGKTEKSSGMINNTDIFQTRVILTCLRFLNDAKIFTHRSTLFMSQFISVTCIRVSRFRLTPNTK